MSTHVSHFNPASGDTLGLCPTTMGLDFRPYPPYFSAFLPIQCLRTHPAPRPRQDSRQPRNSRNITAMLKARFPNVEFVSHLGKVWPKVEKGAQLGTVLVVCGLTMHTP